MSVRVELFMTVLAGVAGGLMGTLWGGLVTGPVQSRWPALRAAGWRPETAARLLAGAVAHALSGAATGFLFWLGWGLVAIVSTPWPLIGVLYGGLVWTAASLPMLSVTWLRHGEPRGAIGLLALESGIACVSAGVLCSYVWDRVG